MRQESRAEALDRYMSAAIDQKLYSNARNLRRHLQYIFDGIDLRDRDVLDIGGGSGLLAVYAAVCGARNAVCVEPEGAGSSSGMRSRLEHGKSTSARHLRQRYDPGLPQGRASVRCDRLRKRHQSSR
jgi:16S rRNA G966 N2-methylase RsmD